ncbi:melanoma-associated antigen B10-like [Mesocricetus auratus]|uniref:Melanoma-associated antigen B10-like n=1 Tax=Mesocricetus auratus TaxID=10036 RepID=A0ABM2XAA0_MESAU|nr:melanoma-associated antigen B10-like [Mesocricetus auratus]
MPRGHKSKLRARERRNWARSESRSLQDAHTITSEERETPSSPLCSSDVQSISAIESHGICKKTQKPTIAPVSVSYTKSDIGKKSQDEERPSTSWALPSTSYSSSAQRDDIAISLVQFILRKYIKSEPIKKEDILKHVIPENKEKFPDVLKKASELMVLAFGIDVKEIDTIRHCYALVSLLNPAGDKIMEGEAIMPKSGLLVTILCVIFMKGGCVNEEYIWEVLSLMGVYAGVDHFVYGNVKKLITKDFVNEGYLEYQRVPYRGSSCYQFLWGPRAQFETGKMRVLEFLAKIHNTVPSAFPSLYQDALRDEQERIEGKFVSMILIGLIPGS